MSLALFLLASYGATNVVTASKLLEPGRARLARLSPRLGAWVRCPMCVGVPVGLGWRLVGLRLDVDLGLPIEALVAGAVASAWCWMVRVVLARLGEDDL